MKSNGILNLFDNKIYWDNEFNRLSLEYVRHLFGDEHVNVVLVELSETEISEITKLNSTGDPILPKNRDEKA